MEILTLELGPFATNAFLLWNAGGNEAVLFDAPPGAEDTLPNVLSERGLELKDVYLTHGHWDHFSGLPQLESTSLETWLHPEDRILVEKPELPPMCHLDFQCALHASTMIFTMVKKLKF